MERFGCRIDCGETFKDGSFNVNMQENGRPHGPKFATTRVRPGDSLEEVVSRLKESAKENGCL
jgi:hypothetical protein